MALQKMATFLNPIPAERRSCIRLMKVDICCKAIEFSSQGHSIGPMPGFPVASNSPRAVPTVIAPQFARNRALAAAESQGNLYLHSSGSVHKSYDLTLF